MRLLLQHLAAMAAIQAMNMPSGFYEHTMEESEVFDIQVDSLEPLTTPPKGPTPNKYMPLKCIGTRQQQRHARQQAKIATRKLKEPT